MKAKQIIITIILCILGSTLFAINYITNRFILRAENVYEIYLGGNIIGFIDDEDELYDMINEKQKEIKDKFDVSTVYPPVNFQIVKTNSYKDVVSKVDTIYNKMSELGTFTVEGYIITITQTKKDSEDKDVVTTKTINVLDKSIFDEAIHTFVLAFVSEDDYNNYINNTQKEIETVGQKIDMMYFDENITIKKGYISVSDDIYLDSTSLSQYLLFGDDYKITKYTVKTGDTISSVSNANKLNVQEFLIANPKFTSEESLLTLGEEVNVTLINPILTFTYDLTTVSDSKIDFEKKIEIDNTKPSSYSVIKTPGVTGITRITTKSQVKNGETQSGVRILDDKLVITQKVDQVEVRGPSYSPITGAYVDTGTTWAWPTNQPYVITSGYAWRWGVMHDAIDISGTGYGSPIYASAEGTIYANGVNSTCGWSGGECVVIAHDNGYYTLYAHLVGGSSSINRVGSRVNRGQVIGKMGATGVVTGYHLHFSVFKGIPYGGGVSIHPLSLWS